VTAQRRFLVVSLVVVLRVLAAADASCRNARFPHKSGADVPPSSEGHQVLDLPWVRPGGFSSSQGHFFPHSYHRRPVSNVPVLISRSSSASHTEKALRTWRRTTSMYVVQAFEGNRNRRKTRTLCSCDFLPVGRGVAPAVESQERGAVRNHESTGVAIPYL